MDKAIIIGATSGIGRGLAEMMVEKDYLVGITGRRTQLLEELKAGKPDSYRINTFDISQTDSIIGHLEELTLELGGLDIIVIGAGTGDLNDKLDFELEKRTIDSNCRLGIQLFFLTKTRSPCCHYFFSRTSR